MIIDQTWGQAQNTQKYHKTRRLLYITISSIRDDKRLH